MRRQSIAILLAGLAAAAAGFLLRQWNLATGFTPETLLPVKGATSAIVLAALGVAALAGAVLAGFAVSRRYTADQAYCRVMETEHIGGLGLQALAGLAILAAGVLRLAAQIMAHTLTAWTGILWAFQILAGLGIVLEGVASFKRTGGKILGLSAVLPALFFCFWLVTSYRDNAREPAIGLYCWMSLALAASSYAAYCTAGFAFGLGRAGKTVFALLITIVALGIALADGADWAERITLGAYLLVCALQLARCLRHLKPRVQPPSENGEGEHGETV